MPKKMLSQLAVLCNQSVVSQGVQTNTIIRMNHCGQSMGWPLFTCST